MAISLGTPTSSTNQTNTTGYSFSHACALNTKALIIVVTGFDASDTDSVIRSVSFNGVTGTSDVYYRNIAGGDDGYVGIWHLYNPPTGTFNVSVSLGGTNTDSQATAIGLISATKDITLDKVDSGSKSTTNSHSSAISGLTTGAVAIAGIVNEDALTTTGSAVLSGNGSQTFRGLNNALGRFSDSGSGNLRSSSLLNITSQSNLSGSSRFTQSGLILSYITSVLSGSSFLSSSGVPSAISSANLSSSSGMDSSGFQVAFGNTITYALSDLNGDGSLEVTSNSLFAGSSNFSESSLIIVNGKVYLSGNGYLFGNGEVIAFLVASAGFISPLFILGISSLSALVSGEAILSGSGQLNVDAFLSVLGSSYVYANGTLSSDSLLEVLGSSALSVLGDLDGDGLLEILSGSGLIGQGNLSADAETIAEGVVTAIASLLGTGSLGADGSVTSFGSVIMTVIGDVNGDGILEILFQSLISGYGDLVATANIIGQVVQDVCGCIIILDRAEFEVSIMDEAI